MLSVGVLILSGSFILAVIALGVIWAVLVVRGKHFALQDRLHKADAIVVLAGTRGNLKFLQGKIGIAVRLYQEGWASSIICSGKFSVKVTDTPSLIPVSALQEAAAAGRIQGKDIHLASATWDMNLGADYMREQAIQMGVPSSALLLEQESLHTRENAEYVLALLKQHCMRRIILVTSPFHQLRTYLTFAKVMRPYGIEIINYYAKTGEWHPLTWFFSAEHRKLVKSERARIKLYREKGDLL